jgi:hypothetical protein
LKKSGKARAHTNIALIKYWGKADEDLIIYHFFSKIYPPNFSIQVCCAPAFSAAATIVLAVTSSLVRIIFNQCQDDLRTLTVSHDKIETLLEIGRQHGAVAGVCCAPAFSAAATIFLAVTSSLVRINMLPPRPPPGQDDLRTLTVSHDKIETLLEIGRQHGAVAGKLTGTIFLAVTSSLVRINMLPPRPPPVNLPATAPCCLPIYVIEHIGALVYLASDAINHHSFDQLANIFNQCQDDLRI